MSLTQDDLRAIQHLIETSEQHLEQRLLPVILARIDELDNTLSIQTAKGFEEVHTRIDKIELELTEVKNTVKRIEKVQQKEIKRTDRHDAAIKHIRAVLRTV